MYHGIYSLISKDRALIFCEYRDPCVEAKFIAVESYIIIILRNATLHYTNSASIESRMIIEDQVTFVWL